ncbi:polysaccharide deacetylase family protein [Streptomyces sp. MP131-18]|uniref:polysaccharide deacetylase family protein n=1 Tax=Streptomyces sp. MP131-18 TaxID=1857892 RepID=UPI000D1B9F63|nr:polysaccharide deacetylase family protein [Streptomyces sp. MP131-18]
MAAAVNARLLRAALGLAAAAVLAAPFAAAWQLHEHRGDVTAQDAAPAPAADPAATAAWRALGAALPDRTPPVVLAYHDIAHDPGNRYTVTPERLDAHLTALAAAGYRTLTAEEFADWAEGGPPPPRGVLLTFDDGTHGLWVHADRILARHGAHGSAFLITGRVGRHRPYYLSWPEISRMHASGRWDFQSHTHDLHTRGADGGGAQGVRADLRRSLDAFAAHGLPRPALFSYPFSETRGFPDALVRDLFTATLTNRAGRPLPPSRRSAPGECFERLEVLSGTTADALVREVARRTPLPPGGDLLADRERWVAADRRPPAPGTLPGGGPRRPAAGRYQYAEYAPHATADWDGYTVRADVSGLTAGGATFGLAARVGGGSPVQVRVSHHRVRLVENGSTRAERRLPRGTAHRVELTVRGGRTTVVVDGRVRLAATADTAPGTGGVAVSASRAGRDVPWPVIDALRVERTGQEQ